MRRAFFGLGAVILVSAVLAGCTSPGVQVHRVHPESLFSRLRDNVLTSGKMSPRTRQLLRRYDLMSRFKRSPGKVLKSLDALVRQQPNPDAVFALAELCYLSANRSERFSKKTALHFYAGSVAYTYYYLFDEQVGTQHSGFDPRFRLACDLYNRSLKRMIKLANPEVVRLDNSMTVEVAEETVPIQITRHGFLWAPEDIDHFEFADEFEVEGLDNHYRSFGLGVPLIAVRKEGGGNVPAGASYPTEHSFPVTAFLRMHRDIRQREGPGPVATLEMYDPVRESDVVVGATHVPLETDLTTPLAYYLSRSRPERFELTGLLRPESVADKAGLFMLSPYEKGKIPVVFVHGLWSSAAIWMPMINDLQGDPLIRDKYQFWFFMYPTGNPFAYSASMLRRSLAQTLQSIDPEGDDKALRDMVLVGHSMGGLLSKMIVQESKDELWRLVSHKSIDAIDATDEEMQKIRNVFFFESQPFVRRVVFIATPHNGSNVSKRPVGRLGSALIALPKALLDLRSKLLARNPDAFTPLFQEELSTSVDNLSPDSPLIQAVANLEIDPRVRFHSIIGHVREGSVEAGHDGVVPYTSSHFEGADSEYVVPSRHSHCQSHPLTVLEVRRILVEHLKQEEDVVKQASQEETTAK